MKFRKKPVVIEAMQFTGDNDKEILSFTGGRNVKYLAVSNVISILTLEGEMRASEGDWIIKGIKGEFYPCKPDIFEETYEVVDG